MAVVKWKVNAMLLAVFDLILTGLHGPYVSHTPWSDDLDVRSKSFDTKLETDLVISFSCCTMADGNSAFFTCNLNQFLSDCRTSLGSSEKVFVLVNSSGFYTRNNEVITEFIDCGQGEELDGLDERAKLSGASKLYIENIIDAAADNVIVKCFFQPRDNCCSIKTT